MKIVLYIIFAFFVAMGCALAPQRIIPLVGIIGLLSCLLYIVVKHAVKDALREYDKEKAEANGQK